MNERTTHGDRSLLGGLLVRDAGLTLRDLQSALDHQRESGGLLGEILVERGLVSKDDVRGALDRQTAIRDDPSLLGGLLVRDAGLTLRALQSALDHQRESGGLLGEILVERGLVSEDDVRASLERQATMRED